MTPETTARTDPIGVRQFARWLGGATLTARADEDERRALAAIATLERNPALARFAVEALTMLPEQHELRRTRLDGARMALRAALDAEHHDVDALLRLLASLIELADPDNRTDALVAEGEALLAHAGSALTQYLDRGSDKPHHTFTAPP